MAADELAAVAAQTDSYFLKTKAVVGHFGDRPATYAVFMRRPVICAPRFAIEFLEKIAADRGQNFDIELSHPEGSWVGAFTPVGTRNDDGHCAPLHPGYDGRQSKIEMEAVHVFAVRQAGPPLSAPRR